MNLKIQMLDNYGVLAKYNVYDVQSQGRDYYVVKRDGKLISVSKSMCTTDITRQEEQEENIYEEYEEYERS